MASYHCCVPHCTNDARYNKNISFHNFPSDINRKKQWLTKIRRDEGPLFQNVIIELGEKELFITEVTSNKVLVQHLYTEISACGRRTDTLKHFAFIAGETYCSLAKDFYCHVFEANSAEELKVLTELT